MNRLSFAGLVAALAFFCNPALAESYGLAPQIINVADRASVSLDGDWKYLVDPYVIGNRTYHSTPLSEWSSYFADRSFDDDRTKLVEYSFDRAHTMRVPGDWNTQYEKFYYYEGHMWYRTTFDASPNPDKRYFLHFGAVNQNAIVGFNGRRLAAHEGGFTPFDVEVTSLIKEGRNSVVLLVDNTRQKDGIPTDICDWWNYGGITRSVKLLEMPKAFIRDYSVLLDKTPVGRVRKGKPVRRTIHGHIQLDGAAALSQVSVSIPELKASAKATVDENGKAEFSIVAAPQLWSPDSPKLYDVIISSEQDTVHDRIGFRFIETDGDRLLLNGEPIFLRGVCIHEEAPFTNNRIVSEEQDRILLGWAKELECNFVRLAHYPHNEEMVRAAEEMGLLVWSEIPVYWAISWDNPSTYANANAQLEDMIKRDINRANVIIWSVANETPISESRTSFLAKLIDRAREMDPTRLVSAAMEKVRVAPNVFTVDDPLLEYTDLISFNQYMGWYSGESEVCDSTSWVFPVKKPVVVTEFGAGALAGNHGDRTERFTEEYMEDCFRRNIEMMTQRMPGLAGTSPWILKDFRSPRRALIGIQDDYNRKGLVSDKGERKSAFYVMQQWYRSLAGK